MLRVIPFPDEEKLTLRDFSEPKDNIQPGLIGVD